MFILKKNRYCYVFTTAYNIIPREKKINKKKGFSVLKHLHCKFLVGKASFALFCNKYILTKIVDKGLLPVELGLHGGDLMQKISPKLKCTYCAKDRLDVTECFIFDFF